MSTEHNQVVPAAVPLVVDVDGTLLDTDLLYESILALLRQRPVMVFAMLAWLFSGKAAFKSRLASQVTLETNLLPVNDAVMARIDQARNQGRSVCLASASDRRLVEEVADRLGPFDRVFASDGQTNLRGSNKARVLIDTFGSGGFDYIGDARPDLAVWAHARRSLVAGHRPGLDRHLAGGVKVERINGNGPDRLAWVSALRPRQWMKNLLVFVPLLTAHSLDSGQWLAASLAFIAFCLVASAVYLFNDLMDLPHDRAHPRKCRRPLASGGLAIPHALTLIPLLILAGLAAAMTVSAALAGLLLAYLVLTSAYTIALKRLMLVDVFVLAVLYTSRVMAGGLATGIMPSEWLLAFSGFVFLSLALIKRQSELADALGSARSRPEGRGYHLEDLPLLTAMAAAAGFSAIVVLTLYLSSAQVLELYSRPLWLWPLSGVLLFWIARMLLLGHRGKLHDDPLVFVLKDPFSLAVAAVSGALFLLSI